MCVTRIARDVVKYQPDQENCPWRTDPADLPEIIAIYNKDNMRFLSYAWGVWITAYARRNLWTGIMACGSDYCYSDTDSIKLEHAERHADFFDKDNAEITLRMQDAMVFHGLPMDATAPVTIDGIQKPLGVWDWDGNYETFKTLGAKRYMVRYSGHPQNGKKAGKTTITIAGVGKEDAGDWLAETYGSEMFEHFTMDGMSIPAEATGKLIHTYIDKRKRGNVTDYKGNRYWFDELSAVHMEPTTYNLNLASDFWSYIKLLKGDYV